MDLLSQLGPFPKKRFPRMVLTLGTFDGVHVGHRAIIKAVRQEALKRKGTAALLTFQEHPQKVLRPDRKTPILTSFEHKLLILRQMGMNLCLAPHFNRSFAEMSPEKFVSEILVRKLGVKKVILGHDSRFGHDREGDVKTMRDLSRKYGFQFSLIPPVRRSGRTVSSTLIRELIQDGNLALAKTLLGRCYSVLATVEKGQGLGRKLGFPTANLRVQSEVRPPHGVYLTKVRWMRNSKIEKEMPGILNFGVRPTLSATTGLRETLEVHLFNWRQSLYGETLEVEFIKRLRKEKKFKSLEDLSRQILRDTQAAKRYFKLTSCE